MREFGIGLHIADYETCEQKRQKKSAAFHGFQALTKLITHKKVKTCQEGSFSFCANEFRASHCNPVE